MNLVTFRTTIRILRVREVERENEYLRFGAGKLHLLPPTVSGLQQPSGFPVAFAQPLSRPFLLAFLPVEVFVLKELALTGGSV